MDKTQNQKEIHAVRVGMKKVWTFGTSYVSWFQKAEEQLLRNSGKKITTKGFVAPTQIVPLTRFSNVASTCTGNLYAIANSVNSNEILVRGRGLRLSGVLHNFHFH